MVRSAAIAAAVCLAGAAGAECRLALVLALDVSSSVDTREYDLQRQGVAAALDSPDVRHAILHGAPGHVMLAVYEWSGRHQQVLQLDWTRLGSEAEIDGAVAVLARMERSYAEFPTALGHGVAYGAVMLDRGPRCDRRVIDVSGDGRNNHGYGPRTAYRHFPMENIVVNGLVILGGPAGVFEYYRDEVLYGPGAFLETADGFTDYRRAMTRKLYREIGPYMLGRPAARPRRARPYAERRG